MYQSMKCKHCLALILLMVLVCLLQLKSAQAEALCGESWDRVVIQNGGVVCSGAHHLKWLEGGEVLHSIRELCKLVAAEDGVWALDVDGTWRFAVPDGWMYCWHSGNRAHGGTVALQNGNGLRDASGAPCVWQLAGRELWLLQLEQHPRVLECIRLPGDTQASTSRLIVHRGQPWISLDGQVWELVSGRWEERGLLPHPDADWWVCDMGYVTCANGRFVGPGAGALPAQCRRWLDCEAELWMQLQTQVWGQLQASGELRRHQLPLYHNQNAGDLQPAGGGIWISRRAHLQQLWQLEDGRWNALHEPLPVMQLQDRLLCYSSRWLLTADGRLLRDAGTEYALCDLLADALSLHRSGPGVLLLCESGLRQYDEQGQLLGVCHAAGQQAACELEDHLIAANGDSLFCWWTQEQSPELQSAMALPDIWRMRASGDWLVAADGESLHLIDIAPPWELEWRDTVPMPISCLDWMLLDDVLLIARGQDFELYSIGAGSFQPVPAGYLRTPAAKLCRRGGDRLLTLSEEGVLSQLHWSAGRPQSLEWSMQLEVSGRIRVHRDSLRVLHAAGYLDLPLPPLQTQSSRPQTMAVMGHQLRKGQCLTWRGADNPSVKIYDLLGRQLATVAARSGQQLHLPPSMSAGSYLLFTEEGDLQRLLLLP